MVGGDLPEGRSQFGWSPTPAPAHTQMNNILLCSWGHIIRCHNKPSRENNGMWENGNIVGGWNDNNNKPVHTIHPFTRPTNQLTNNPQMDCLPASSSPDWCMFPFFVPVLRNCLSLTLSPALPWKLTPNEWKLANERPWPPPLSQLSQSVSQSVTSVVVWMDGGIVVDEEDDGRRTSWWWWLRRKKKSKLIVPCEWYQSSSCSSPRLWSCDNMF